VPTEVVIPYVPRRQFKPFHERAQRWSVIVAHRRCGKTVACINDLIRSALTCKHPHGRYAYIAPYHNQAKDIAWDYLKRYSAPIPNTKINNSDLFIDYPNGSRVRLYGADNPDRIRGLYMNGVVIDEPADINPSVFPLIIRPQLTDYKGWATWIGTPKGHNSFHDRWKKALKNKDGNQFSLMLKASETGLVDPEELAEAREDMSVDEFEQEFECSFEAAIKGAYYGKEMKLAAQEGRICRVPWEPKLEVHTAWDLGIGDATVIWFIQQHQGEVRFIDCYSNFSEGLEHYVKVLKERPYIYGTHILPHDIEVADLSTGRSRLQTLAGLGINGYVLKRDPIEDGINAVRSMLPRCWFDAEKCDTGIEALKQYRTEYDEDKKTYSTKPLHDWTSDYADAARYAARGLPDQSYSTKPRDRYARDRSSSKSAWASL
jgi:phage terminase large subunit